MNEILPGVFHWTAKHPRIGIEVSSHWLEDGGVAIDPLLSDEQRVDWFAERETPPTAVLLSNRHHHRSASVFQDAFGATVHVSRPGIHAFEGPEHDVHPFDFGDTLPGGAVAVEIGGICPDDTALFLPAHRAILVADGIVSGGPHGEGDIGFVPATLMDDPERTRATLLDAFRRVLADHDFDHVLLAHGPPMIGDGRARLQAFVDEGGRTA